MKAPPLGPGGEDSTWPDQVATRGRNASSTRRVNPQTSNFAVCIDMKSVVAPQSTKNSTLESKKSSRRAQMRHRTVNRDACSGWVPSTLTPPSVELFSGLLVLIVEFRSSQGRPPPGLRRCFLGRRGPFSALGAGSKTFLTVSTQISSWCA